VPYSPPRRRSDNAHGKSQSTASHHHPRTTTTTHQQQQQPQSIGSISSITILTHALLQPKHDEKNTEKRFASLHQGPLFL
jgi:hypothetical protein